ncbi:MAG: 4-hydroxy-tetrahydrodipicolinate reductase [Culturomica sp.]|jgi:4-hydroxy-tetrahydrodipicolinate reductase|nr:4-hydroxy-tetrahydrodipicolinate reductase [Culturomica sp.]
MKIALLGYGKMGKAIEKIALARGHEVILKIDAGETKDDYTNELKKADAAIDFSVPSAAVDNYKWCFETGVPVVSGTTGWLERWDEVVEACNEKSGGFFYASNFSIGVNLFFRLNRELAKMMDNFHEYSAEVEEIHHVHKLDAPSGTAISVLNDIVGNNSKYNSWKLKEKENDHSSHSNDVLPVTASREGEVPGTHVVTYRSSVDEITIKHEAYSREGFALGAVIAAEFMKGRHGVFGMEDIMK